MFVKAHPEDSSQHIIDVVKHNYVSKPKAWEFITSDKGLTWDGETDETYEDWEGIDVRDSEARNDCEVVILDFISEGQEYPWSDIEEHVIEETGSSSRTIIRARTKLKEEDKIDKRKVARKDRKQGGSKTVWFDPNAQSYEESALVWDSSESVQTYGRSKEKVEEEPDVSGW